MPPPEFRRPAVTAQAARGPRRGWRRLPARLRSLAPLLPGGLSLYLGLKGLHPALPGWPCPLRSLTGIPCPTCFLTRSTAAALSGRLEEALQLHAFGPVVAAGLLAWSLLALRHRRLLPITIRGPELACFCLALLAYWLARLLLQFGFGVAAFPPSA
ncbi:MAG: DUF2752 domain-containing protein [Cyanobium sp.]